MPYIDQVNRPFLRPETYGNREAENPGELNYQLTCLLLQYWHRGKKNYQAINDILGALEGAKLEFYRRVVAPYEDQKIKDNGDVY